ncbi:MAG TPA: hypothetical protein VEB21_12950 [Terriglobales bacterium]|nr:hypothetical protein [Terriglobales bacterium]
MILRSTAFLASILCAAPALASSAVAPVRLAMVINGEVQEDRVQLLLLLASEADVAGLQTDLLFDNRTLRPAGGCRIAADIAASAAACEQESPLGPCKNLMQKLAWCGDAAPGCSWADPAIDRLRLILAGTAVMNSNPIPDGVLASCDFEVLDSSRLPASIAMGRVVASDAAGNRLDASGSGVTLEGKRQIDRPHFEEIDGVGYLNGRPIDHVVVETNSPGEPIALESGEPGVFETGPELDVEIFDATAAGASRGSGSGGGCSVSASASASLSWSAAGLLALLALRRKR